MSKIEKLIRKLKAKPNDLTWDELKRILNHFGFEERKGKGSRRKFVNPSGRIISLHEPHPQKVVKKYVLDLVIEFLNLEDDA